MSHPSCDLLDVTTRNPTPEFTYVPDCGLCYIYSNLCRRQDHLYCSQTDLSIYLQVSWILMHLASGIETLDFNGAWNVLEVSISEST